MLGFYVSLVVKRWWEQYCKLPWPDTIAYYLAGLVVTSVPGEARVRARMVRRTVVRYCILGKDNTEPMDVFQIDVENLQHTFSASGKCPQD